MLQTDRYRLKSSLTPKPLLLVAQLLMIIGVVFSSENLEAKIIFEGYYKLSQRDIHIGFFIQRYEYDAKKKQFKSTTFLRTNPNSGDIQESLVALASQSLKPISYRYTTVSKSQTKTIDAQFKNDVMTAVVTTNKKPQQLQVRLPQGAFLSTFLTYMILQSPQGLSKGLKFSFQAMAEEDARVFQGQAYIESEVVFKDQRAFRILNTFKNSKFVNIMNIKGEPLFTRSPLQGITAELVKDPIDATSNQPYNPKNINTVFNGTPKGNINDLAKAKGP